jgi:hypothetical protein
LTQTYNRRAPNQDNVVVPQNFKFNQEAIKGYLNPNLPEGVLVENIQTLTTLGYIQKVGSKFKMTPPIAQPA